MSSLNWIDRTIAYFSPQRGEARARARSIMGAILAYDGAKAGRRTDGWSSTSGQSPTAEVSSALRPMRERARDLVRNNPHATKALGVIVANKIGTGIMASPLGAGSEKQVEAQFRYAAKLGFAQNVIALAGRKPNRRKASRLHEHFKRWSEGCDITGKLNFEAVQSLAERTRSESGEAIVRLIPTKPESERDVPLRLQVLEPDFIDESRNEVLRNGHVIRDGVEFNGPHVVAYWLFDAHPGDSAPTRLRRGFQSFRVDAFDVIHYFKPLRPGQIRGMTDFHPVILRLRDLDDWHDAKLMRAKISACSVAAVTTPSGLPGASLAPTTTNSAGERQEQFNPGMYHYMRPGESVEFFDPKPLDDSQFNSDELHAVAAGLNMPYELLTGDLSEVTYTSHRGGLVQFRGMIEADQWQVVVPQLCGPICSRFALAASLIDGTVDPEAPWVYTPPRFGLLDPAKEIPATVLAVQSGLESYPNALRRDGYDWLEKLDEIEEFQKEVKDRAIRISSVPPPEPEPDEAPPAKKEAA